MTHPTQALHIPDTQSERDERHVAIQRVGVKDVRYPLRLRVGNAEQTTAAAWDLDVALPAEKKGTVSAPIWMRIGATMVLPVNEPMLTTM